MSSTELMDNIEPDLLEAFQHLLPEVKQVDVEREFGEVIQMEEVTFENEEPHLNNIKNMMKKWLLVSYPAKIGNKHNKGKGGKGISSLDLLYNFRNQLIFAKAEQQMIKDDIMAKNAGEDVYNILLKKMQIFFRSEFAVNMMKQAKRELKICEFKEPGKFNKLLGNTGKMPTCKGGRKKRRSRRKTRRGGKRRIYRHLAVKAFLKKTKRRRKKKKTNKKKKRKQRTKKRR